jgi:transcription elongation factor Elf1
MHNHIDIEFIRILSSQLKLYKEKGNNLFNFRCPVCGDSKRSRVKARGYLFQKKNDFFYKCHNCSIGLTLGNLIKHIDIDLHKQYIMARYTSDVSST